MSAAGVPGASPARPQRLVGRLEVSKDAGLGRIELRGKIAAVLQRDEGAVALIDISNPAKPKVLGRYDDDIQDSFDGDLAFSDDGRWLFYARQTHQFSKDGIHVLDVADPKAPTLRTYQPQGGTLRIAYFKGAGGEWVFSLDAIHGLVVNRFVPEAGALAPVHIDALPALKVGGPASGGLFIDPKDPKLGVPLLYAATGQTGVQMFDISDPLRPALLGAWDEVGLAEIEVVATKKGRTIFGATEYWFDKQLEPQVIVLDATKPDSIKQRTVWSVGCPPDDQWRVQGMVPWGRGVLAANSHWGLVEMSHTAGTTPLPVAEARRNEAATVLGDAPYVFDVEVSGKYVYATDAANGYLSILGTGKLADHPQGGNVSSVHCS